MSRTPEHTGAYYVVKGTQYMVHSVARSIYLLITGQMEQESKKAHRILSLAKRRHSELYVTEIPCLIQKEVGCAHGSQQDC